MRSFFDLVGFEYKKILKRKGTVISLIIVTIVLILAPMSMLVGNTYINGEKFETKYQNMTKNRDKARTLADRHIDETLLTEAKEAFSKIPAIGENESFVGLPEYQEYGRPYANIYEIVYSVYGSSTRLMQSLTQEQMQNLYNVRHEKAVNNINAMKISDKSKEKLIQLDSEIQTPFIFSYVGGYNSFFGTLYIAGVFAAFVIAICLAPMFAGEYGTRTDQLILSSKFGKNKIIGAKLFTGVSFCFGICVALIIIVYLVCGVIYGFDGGNAPVQLSFLFSIYPFTMLQVAAVCSMCVLFAAVLVGGVTLLLSSIFKSPFGVIIITTLLIFVPIMFNAMSIQNIILLNLLRLLPANMMLVWGTSANYTPYELFGLTIPPHMFLPTFAVLATGAMLPFAWRAFKNHQIS